MATLTPVLGGVKLQALLQAQARHANEGGPQQQSLPGPSLPYFLLSYQLREEHAPSPVPTNQRPERPPRRRGALVCSQ